MEINFVRRGAHMSSKFLQHLLVLLILATGFSTANVQADTAIFMEIPGVKGESTNANFRDHIDVLRAGATFQSGVCVGFVVTKELDIASPILVSSVVLETIYTPVTLSFQTIGEFPFIFLEMVLNDVKITSIEIGGGVGADRSAETLTLEPASLTLNYTRQNDDGSEGGAVSETVLCNRKPKT